MAEFLELLPPTRALEYWLSYLPQARLDSEQIATELALGRTTACPVRAPEDLPGFPRSSVDGYAVRAADTYGASEALPAYLAMVGELPMGKAPAIDLGAGQAALIHTGGMLPVGSNAVVMLEYTQLSRQDEIEVLRAVADGENILKPGEDVRAGDVILPAGCRLRPADIGGLMALGLTEVEVVRQPCIGILSTGDEVVPPSSRIRPGEVRDINSYTLGALVEQCGGKARRYGVFPDRADTLREGLAAALLECDSVVITAGSSASTRDLTAEAIQEMGAPGVLVHGVNIRPGKPTILAVCNGKAVIGLPGNPVSALVVAGLFVKPVCQRLLGVQAQVEVPIEAALTINLASQAGREDYIPARILPGSNGWLAEPIFFKSNLIFCLARADGLLHIPADVTGLAAGDRVKVLPL